MLPVELLRMVGLALPFDSLSAYQGTCHLVYQCCSSASFWVERLKQDFPHEPVTSNPEKQYLLCHDLVSYWKSGWTEVESSLEEVRKILTQPGLDGLHIYSFTWTNLHPPQLKRNYYLSRENNRLCWGLDLVVRVKVILYLKVDGKSVKISSSCSSDNDWTPSNLGTVKSQRQLVEWILSPSRAGYHPISNDPIPLTTLRRHRELFVDDLKTPIPEVGSEEEKGYYC